MSQQQFVPQDSSHSNSNGSAEIYQYKPMKGRSSDMPKEEHPSTFAEPLPPYSYHAQDRVAHETIDPTSTAHAHETNARERQARRQRFSPDGDALENGYQPYQQQQRMRYQVPPWARPQQHNLRILRRVILVILVLILIKPIVIFAAGLFLTSLSIIGIIILIPFIILSALIVTGLVLTILAFMLGRTVWHNVWRR